jgi:ribonucleoside-diphosphate reductase beta chain
MSIFNLTTSRPDNSELFFGDDVGIIRHDIPPLFIQKSIDNQTKKRWFPHDITLCEDKVDYKERLTESEQFMFDKNFSRQKVLDSLAGRGQVRVLLPIVSHPGLVTAIIRWSDFEEVHNETYTWIQNNIYSNSNEIDDTILDDKLLLLCASTISKYYDDLEYWNSLYTLHNLGHDTKWNLYSHKRALLRALFSINVFEAIRFQVSFACTFSFGKRGLMKGSSDLLALIARDEQLHVQLSQSIIKHLIREEDDYAKIFVEDEMILKRIINTAYQEEKDWLKYIFSIGSIYGFSLQSATQFLDYLTSLRIRSFGWEADKLENPIPWYNSMINRDDSQVAAMEEELTTYVKGSLSMDVNINDFKKYTGMVC